MPSIAFIAFTQRGGRLASMLAAGMVREHGNCRCSVQVPQRLAAELQLDAFENLDAWTAAHFAADDALVFVGATGIAVRAIAPHVADKFSDPAVVGIDEAGSYAVPLLSGHVGGANRLARQLAQLAGGQAAVSTATDVNGLFAVDEWAAENGYALVERDLAKEVSAALLQGDPVGFWSDRAVSAPAGLGESADAGIGVAVSLDAGVQPFARTLHLVPRVVHVGVGCRKGTDPGKLQEAVDEALAAAGVSPQAVAALATIDVKRDEPAVCQLARHRGWPLRCYTAQQLAAVPGSFSHSPFVEQTVGVGNVCERAACAEGAQVMLAKQAGDGVTVALAQLPADAVESIPATGPQGRLFVVGLGPGGSRDMTGWARRALQQSDLIVGYPVYIDLLQGEFPGKEVFTTPMRKEVERCQHALQEASRGRTVAMVCSGDPGVYGMAGLVLELAGGYPGVDIQVVPGVSASTGGAAVLGAPLMHDHCLVSLSDLLTPWETIEARLRAAAQADFVVVLYNPSSHKRPDYLQKACDVLLECKAPETVCGLVRNIGREGQESRVLTLGELRDTPVDMFTTVFVGSSRTREIDGKMVTPRGYLQREG